MKTKRLKIAAAIIAATCFLQPGIVKAQTCNNYDFTSNTGWTNVSSGVTINNGRIDFTGAAEGSLPRYTYRTLPATLSNTAWSCDFEFRMTGGSGPYHSLLAFTESGSSVISTHCKRDTIAGPVTYSNMNAIEVRINTLSTTSTNPQTWEIIGASKRRVGTFGYNASAQPWQNSAPILLSTSALNTTYYGRLQRLSPTLGMITIYPGPARTPGTEMGCATFPIHISINNLNMMQSGNICSGATVRTFWGSVDNVRICDLNPTLTGDQTVCTTSVGTTYSLSNGNNGTFDQCGFPGALSYTWSAPSGSTMSPGSWGQCFNLPSGHGNECVIDVGSDGYVNCTVNYPCTTVVYPLLIDVSPPPTAAIANTTSPYCEGEQIILNGSSSLNETSYQWSAVQCDISGTPTGTWNYGPTLTGSAGLFNLATVVSPSLLNCHRYYKVQLRTYNGMCHPSAPVFKIIEIVCPPDMSAVSSPTLICQGGSSTLTASGATTYAWSPSTGLSCPTCAVTQASPTSSQIYTVTGTNPHCPSESVPVIVNVSTISANAGPDHTVCCWTKDTIPLVVTGNPISYVWSPSTNFICSHSGAHPPANCPNPIVSACETTTYSVTVTDPNGCTATDQVTITPVACRMAGSEQTMTDNTLSIYPNPATQLVTINTGNVLADNISIMDALGRECYSVKPVSTLTEVDLSTLPAGIYLIKVMTNNEIQTLQLVIE